MITVDEKYIDVDKINKDIIEFTQKSKHVCDIFIIIKMGSIHKIYDNVDDLFSFLLKNKNIISSKNIVGKLMWLDFVKNFSLDTNKYKTYIKLTTYKFNRTLNIGNKSDKEYMDILKKDPLLIRFLRKYKLNRIISNVV